MLSKFKLIINGIYHNLANDCLKNWDSISCSYKRVDFSGIVRSFTSQFEFIGEAYDLLLNLFYKHGFKAKAVFELYVINDNWEYHREFSCDLDFSSISWTNTVLSINAIDNSIASIIKANKSTKFEFVIDEDIPTSYPYAFDRIQVTETATYSITDGESQDDGSIIGTYNPENNYRIYVGQINKENGVGGYVITKDDQEYGDGYMLDCIKSNNIKVSYNIKIDARKGCASLKLMNRNSVVKELSTDINSSFCVQFKPGYTFNTIDDVRNLIDNDVELKHSWAVDTDLWRHRFADVAGIAWNVITDITGTNEWNNTGETVEEYVTISFSDTFDVNAYSSSKFWLKFDSNVKRDYCIKSSEIKFSWKARGSKVQIKTITPVNLIEAVLAKMVACDVIISDYDERINTTLLLAAESIRNIPKARIYTSFNDFCEWMETVFGYTYFIDEDNNLIHFVHRTEIFKENAPIKTIKNANELEYNVDSSILYSNIVIGYEKQDYESVNGRDEFNFNNTYTTGYTVTDKKFQLKSKYRADSYGIEFLVQKRNSDTTDNESDNDIFFVLGGNFNGEYYQTVRKAKIENTDSNTLINGEFSPIQCIYANREYIGMMADYMELFFTSSEGNSNVEIDNLRMSETLYLEDLEMLSSGILKFKTDDLTKPSDWNCIVRVETSRKIYTGYIKEVDIRYTHQSSVEYNLIVKSIESCL